MRTSDQLSYADRLRVELDEIGESFQEIISSSSIENVNPNRGLEGTGIFIATSRHWDWKRSDDNEERACMALLQRVHLWEPKFRLLFPHPTRQVQKRINKGIKHLKKWLLRDGKDSSVPASIVEAQEISAGRIADLRSLFDLLPKDEFPIRIAIDTNAIIDNPDLTSYTGRLGRKYVVHLLPVVLGELDDLKRAGRNSDLREAARRADKRLKGIRTNGDVREGVCVGGEVIAKFEHTEPRSEALPAWLDLSVPDDRFVASTLLLQSEHPGSTFYVATSDINLQTKLSATGLPYLEPSD
jgi:rRNA-processing protein FCF1